MRNLEKSSLLLVAIGYFVSIALVGANLVTTVAAILLSVLIRFACPKLSGPKTVQEETMEQAGFTGLSLNSPPAQKRQTTLQR